MTQRGKSVAARADATGRTLRIFQGRAFDWASGATCLHLAREQARALGHRGLPRIPALAGPVDALRHLHAQGAATLAELMDQHFKRLPAPAFALVGDLLLLPGEDGTAEPFGALVVSDGAGSVLGWHDSQPEFAVIKDFASAALVGWRL